MVEFDPSAENLLSILGASFDIAGATLLARALESDSKVCHVSQSRASRRSMSWIMASLM